MPELELPGTPQRKTAGGLLRCPTVAVIMEEESEDEGLSDDDESPVSLASPHRRGSAAPSQAPLFGPPGCSRCQEPFTEGKTAFRDPSMEGAGLCRACAEKAIAEQPKQCGLCEEALQAGEAFYRSSKDSSTCLCSSCFEVVKAHRAGVSVRQAAAARRPLHCTDCREPFAPDSLIFGCAADSATFLCQSCADLRNAAQPSHCSACQAELVEGRAYRRGDQVLCEHCAEASLPTCAACKRPAMGRVVVLSGKSYHADCVRCWMCSVKISESCSVMPQGPSCAACSKKVSEDLRQIVAFLEAGDIAAARELASTLQAKGVQVPDLPSSADDLATAVSAEEEEEMARVLCMFREYDSNGDGFISEDELGGVLVGLGIPQEAVHPIFASADTNNDGRITYQEFVHWAFKPAPSKVAEHFAGLLQVPSESALVDDCNELTPFELLSSFWVSEGGEQSPS